MMRLLQITPLLRSPLRITIVALALALCCFGAAEDSALKIDPAKAKLARKLVNALNDDSYQVRLKAREILPHLGRAAIDPLEFAAKSEESETRLRAEEILMALRGQGMLGINLTLPPFVPEWGAGVAAAPENSPAGQAGVQSGDVVLAINNEPVEDSNGLRQRVFAAGPARNVDLIVQRGDERLHLTVLLMLYASQSVSRPPVDLERELPDVAAREQVRQEFITKQFGGFAGQVRVVNGQIVPVAPAETPQALPPPMPEEIVNVQQLEAEFNRVKADAEKEKAQSTQDNDKTAAK
ncbi:MAG TPA: PDZ domain-containing protein [Planctomycetota bacterium]|nr:PDZ domain-containing protein [Planctomycetota bacterium]